MFYRYLVPMLFVLAACSSARTPNSESANKEKATEPVAATAPAKTEAPAPTQAGAELAELPANLTCTSGSDKRLVNVVKAEAGGCEVVYTKFEKEDKIATASSGVDYCQKVQAKVATNLTNAGFKCE